MTHTNQPAGLEAAVTTAACFGMRRLWFVIAALRLALLPVISAGTEVPARGSASSAIGFLNHREPRRGCPSPS